MRENEGEIPRGIGEEFPISLPEIENPLSNSLKTTPKEDVTFSLPSPSSDTGYLHQEEVREPLPMSTYITIGTHTKRGIQLFSNDVEEIFYGASMRCHEGTPWLKQWLRTRYKIDLDAEPAFQEGDSFTVERDLLVRHSVICGSSGSGKTMLSLHMVRDHLQAGGSAVVMDVKDQTIRQALAMAEEAGIQPEQITLLWPREQRYGIPVWNPFAVPTEKIRPAVREFVSILKEIFISSWGARMDDLMKNAATVIAALEGTIEDLIRFLKDDSFRDGVLSKAESIRESFPEEVSYFHTEFANLSTTERNTAIMPITNKIRFLATNPYLKELFCGAPSPIPHQNIDLPSLWQRQRLILIHLDNYELGDEATAFMVSLFTRSLFTAAQRQETAETLPVLLLLDEAGATEKYAGEGVSKILRQARSFNLRLIVACQHLNQLSSTLLDDLLSSTYLRVFFNLGMDDARRVSRSMAEGIGEKYVRIQIDQATNRDTVTYRVQDAWRQSLAFSDSAWEAIAPYLDTEYMLEVIYNIAELSGRNRLYITSKDGTYELRSILQDMPFEQYTFTGPAPLTLQVTYPEPMVRVFNRQSEEERARLFSKEITSLPRAHAFARTGVGNMGLLKIVPVQLPQPLPEASHYLIYGRSQQQLQNEAAERASRFSWQRETLPEPIPVPKTPRKKKAPVVFIDPRPMEIADDGTL